jgi:uncharacterized protein (UPF0333 family)
MNENITLIVSEKEVEDNITKENLNNVGKNVKKFKHYCSCGKGMNVYRPLCKECYDAQNALCDTEVGLQQVKKHIVNTIVQSYNILVDTEYTVVTKYYGE